MHVSLGRLLRAIADTAESKSGSDASKIKECITNGELVPLDIVMKIVESHMASNMTAGGIILDGFPRDMTQAAEFENKVGLKKNFIFYFFGLCVPYAFACVFR